MRYYELLFKGIRKFLGLHEDVWCVKLIENIYSALLIVYFCFLWNFCVSMGLYWFYLCWYNFTCFQIVPSNLISYIQGTEPQDMSLRDCNKNIWQLKIEKFGEDWYFTDGWVKFVKDNMIKGGDVLFYQYSTQGLLDFKVFGSSGCENDRIDPLTTTGQDEKVEVKIEEEEAADDIDKRPHKKRSNRRSKKKIVVDGEFYWLPISFLLSTMLILVK